jgi:osmoprotectant transport system substrate-binding protein
VTRATAARYRLRRVGDLRTVAPHLRFGGPPECPTRPFCLQGLARVYGLKFERFVPMDVGGPLTRSALETNGIDVALLFTTDAAISRDGFVVLDDDRGLQPAESVTPLVRRELVERHGTGFVRTVNDVSRRLTTEVLRELNGRVARGTSIDRVARSWLAQAGDA